MVLCFCPRPIAFLRRQFPFLAFYHVIFSYVISLWKIHFSLLFSSATKICSKSASAAARGPRPATALRFQPFCSVCFFFDNNLLRDLDTYESGGRLGRPTNLAADWQKPDSLFFSFWMAAQCQAKRRSHFLPTQKSTAAAVLAPQKGLWWDGKNLKKKKTQQRRVQGSGGHASLAQVGADVRTARSRRSRIFFMLQNHFSLFHLFKKGKKIIPDACSGVHKEEPVLLALSQRVGSTRADNSCETPMISREHARR